MSESTRTYWDICHPCLAGLDVESAAEVTPQWYAVSSGNGNDGVSHSWPDYYVRICPADAYRLAECAMVDSFNPGAGKAWARDNVEVDGEAEYTVSATIYDPPADETDSEDEESGSYSEFNGAWQIVEVFPYGGEPDTSAPQYDSLESAISAETLALVD